MRYFTVLILGLFLSCNIFENENDIVPNEYIGEWSWVGTYGGWGPNVSADSVDYQIDLLITKMAEAKWYRDGELKGEYNISIGKDSWTEGKLVMYRSAIVEEHDCGFIMDLYQDETLVLSSAHCTDQPSIHFIRQSTK